MTRALALLIGLIAAVGGSYYAFQAMRAVGPENRTGDFGFGDAAVAPPGGGTLLQGRNFARVVTALERELGSDGAVQTLNVEWLAATAYAYAGNRLLTVSVDASGRSQSRDAGDASPGALVPINRIDPAAVDKLVAAARKETGGVGVEKLTLEGSSREWRVYMLRGEPDQYVANLDGGGLRLPGEPNPEPIGAGPDSLLRTKNLERVLAAARKEGEEIRSLSVRPERISLTLDAGGRDLALDYGYDAQLTRRDIGTRTGADSGSIGFDDLDLGAIERMARTSRRAAKTKGLADVQYVLLNLNLFPGSKPELTMYFTQGHEPPYVFADLHGRHLSWPGRD